MADDSGQTIGKFKLVNCLASGQHSQVWEAIDNETTRRVAVKMLLPEAMADPEQLSAHKSEFKIGKSLEHPNLLKYHEYFTKSELFGKTKQAYFTMDLFPAQNLKGWFHNDLRGVHIRFKRMVELLSSALEHMHERGWIHRDIKPDNILMSKAAEVRLIDFSLASHPAGALGKVFSRKQSTVKGTRTYMAPEQIRGLPLTEQTDIYNLGVTLFELLVGQAPFAGCTPKEILLRHCGVTPPVPSSINTNITPEMDRILLRMLAKKPKDRQKSVSEFAVEFRNVTVFVEPVVEEAKLTEEEEAHEALKKVLGGALDSRADALRTKLGIAAPVVPKKPKPKPAAAKPTAASPSVQPQMAPGMMPPMQPMMPPMGMPAMPYPMPAPYGAPGMPSMPGMPVPGMPMPGGPSPWVSVPAPGGPAAPWMGQPMAPQPGMPRPAQPVSPGVPPVAARPAPPPVAPTAVPQVAVNTPVAPVISSPPAQKPAGRSPAPGTQKVASPASTNPEQGMKIDDLLGFDELPPV